jgi:hypothetical protein
MISNLLRRAARAAGRVVGAVEQLRDCASAALLPLDVPAISWERSLRLALDGLLGRDLGPFLRARNAVRSTAAEAARDHEERLRAHFAKARERN